MAVYHQLNASQPPHSELDMRLRQTYPPCARAVRDGRQRRVEMEEEDAFAAARRESMITEQAMHRRKEAIDAFQKGKRSR
jgi:hypothetical protein